MKKQLFLCALVIALLAAVGASPAAAGGTGLAVNAGAALEGAFGLEVFVEDNSEAYVETAHPNDETIYRFGFLIDPNDITIAAKKAFIMGIVFKTQAPNKARVFLWMHMSADSQYWRIQSNVRNDDGSFQAWQTPVIICGTPASGLPCDAVSPVRFDFEWVAATGPGANDGVFRVYKNGTLRKTFSGIDSDLQTIDFARFGTVFAGTDPSVNGSYFFDSFSSFRSLFP